MEKQKSCAVDDKLTLDQSYFVNALVSSERFEDLRWKTFLILQSFHDVIIPQHLDRPYSNQHFSKMLMQCAVSCLIGSLQVVS